MNHQWAQFSHHDAPDFKLSNHEERKLIEAWQQSGSFDDVIIEAQQTQGVAQ